MYSDIGLLLMRVLIGSFMLFAHGWGKLANFGVYSQKFPALFGLPSSVNLGLAVFSEVFCSIALILGIKTKWASVPLLITMLVAAFIVHAGDPWGKKEFALLYAIPYLTLFFTGPGGFSLDAYLQSKK